MDTGTMLSIGSAVGSCFAGWYVGKFQSRSIVLNDANSTIGILSARADALDTMVKDLESKIAQKDNEIAALNGRVNVLADLATQRAEVAAVKAVVDAIAVKVGADVAA